MQQQITQVTKGTAVMPSPDELAAEVLTNHCHILEWRVAQGQTLHMGIFRLQGIPFLFQMTWDKNPKEFNLTVWQVRPRSTKKVVDRQFKNT